MEWLSPEERILREAPLTGRLAQAYLLHAQSPAAADASAHAFISRILCERHTGCGKCTSCVKLAGGSHVDLFSLEGEDPVKKEEVEVIPDFLSSKAFEGGYKCVYIRGAERLNPQAQNLLLKSVEEPPENVVFVFSTANLSAVLPTIRSRCIQIAIRPRPRSEVRAAVSIAGGEFADVYAAWAFGSEDEASALMSDPCFLEDRDAVFHALRILCTEHCPSAVMLGRLFSDRFLQRTMIAAAALLDAAMLFFGSDASLLYCPDRAEVLQLINRRFTTAGLSLMIDVLLSANRQKSSCPGLNVRLAADSMILELLEVKSRCLR